MKMLGKRVTLVNRSKYNLQVTSSKCKRTLNKVRLLKISQRNRIKSNQDRLLLKINFKNKMVGNWSKFLRMKNYRMKIFLMKMK